MYCHFFSDSMKDLPEKFNRYMIFGRWLCNTLQLSQEDSKQIHDLFKINSSLDEQVSFYSKFHEEYASIEKIVSKEAKMLIQENKNKNKKRKLDMKQEISIHSEIEVDDIWEIDSDFLLVLKEMV